MLEVEVCEIRVESPVYKMGNKMTIDGSKIVKEKTDAVCVHPLSSLWHYVIALDENVDPRRLGLSRDKEIAYMECVDPWKLYTKGGSVTFKC